MNSLGCAMSVCCVLLMAPSAAWSQIAAEPEATLWSAGQLQLQVGELYARDRSDVTDRRVSPLRSDGAISFVGLRYGPSNRLQLSATAPVCTTSATPGVGRGGLDAVEAQADVLLRGDAVDTFALIAQVGVAATSRQDDLDGIAWSPTVGLQAFKRSDPTLQLWAISYTRGNDQRFGGRRVAPGSTVRAQSGIGIRVDDSRTAWLVLTTAYTTGMRLDGSTLAGSDRLESSVGVAMNWMVGSHLDIEWSTTTGLSADAPDVALGVTVTYTTLGPRSRRPR